MVASVKKRPAFKVRIYDLSRTEKRRCIGKEIMDIIIYLPGTSVPCTMTPRFVSYQEGRGKAFAIMFTGVQLNLDDKNLRRLCGRLALARRSLVAYVRNLAKA
jgi:hypothetical protein